MFSIFHSRIEVDCACLSPCSVVSLDFKRMRVLNKDLMVRRLDDGRSKWIWYCMLSSMWQNYGTTVDPPVLHWGGGGGGFLCIDTYCFAYTQDAKGNRTPLSEAIEDSFQRKPSGSFTFSIGSETYEIHFRGGVYFKKMHAACGCLAFRY